MFLGMGSKTKLVNQIDNFTEIITTLNFVFKLGKDLPYFIFNGISAFGIGFLVSLFLVPCASGPYVVILGKLAEKTDTAKTFTLLMLYNLVFVSPMIMITLGMYFFNAKLSKLEKMRRENLRLLHAITGVIMLSVGLWLIYTKL